jgi:hypothetical protein
MISIDEEYSLLVRCKVNQKHPTVLVITKDKIQNWGVSFGTLKDLLRSEFPGADLDKSIIRYLDKNKHYVRLREDETLSLRGEQQAEIFVDLVKDADKTYETRNALKPFGKIVKLSEADASEKIAMLERTLENMRSVIDSFVGKVGSDYSSALFAEPVFGNQRTVSVENAIESNYPPAIDLARHQSMASNAPSRTRGLTDARGVSELKKNMSYSAFGYKQGLHFAILYSNPMVDVRKLATREQTVLLTNDPVDFSGECYSILSCLESHRKKVNVHIECASSDQFSAVLREKPLILHIMCHGDFNTDTQEYFLEFENGRAELFRLSPSILKEMTTSDLSDTQLVFINACHSEVLSCNPACWTSLFRLRRQVSRCCAVRAQDKR